MSAVVADWLAAHPPMSDRTWNPLLREYLEACGGEGWHFGSRLLDSPLNFRRAFEARARLVGAYAWAVPDDGALDLLASLGPIVEMGAGTGYWARLLANRGVDVIAYDAQPTSGVAGAPKRNGWLDEDARFFDVRKAKLNVLRKHADRTLLLVWPPYDTPMAYRAQWLYRGKRLAFVGEWGGATGDDAFTNALERDWQLVERYDIPTWPTIHDALFVLERRE